jgi:hypothetical protein
MSESQKPCPSLSGTMRAYVAEYKNSDGIWKRIRIEDAPVGIMRDQFNPDILHTVDLLGWEAAMALAWVFKANCRLCEIRIVPSEVQYSVSATRKENEAYELPLIEPSPIRSDAGDKAAK